MCSSTDRLIFRYSEGMSGAILTIKSLWEAINIKKIRKNKIDILAGAPQAMTKKGIALHTLSKSYFN